MAELGHGLGLTSETLSEVFAARLVPIAAESSGPPDGQAASRGPCNRPHAAATDELQNFQLGKEPASCSTVGGSNAAEVQRFRRSGQTEPIPDWLARPVANRHLGQMPCGESAGNSQWHCGQTRGGSIGLNSRDGFSMSKAL